MCTQIFMDKLESKTNKQQRDGFMDMLFLMSCFESLELCHCMALWVTSLEKKVWALILQLLGNALFELMENV